MAQLLHQTGIVFGQVDGTLPSHRRQEVLKKFHHDSSVMVLLMTLGTGAAGYTSYFPNPECLTHCYNCRLNNLSVASRVYILEPQWNPSVEDQAIGRVLRLGQDKQVCIIRYVTSGTIEEASRTSFTRLSGQLSNSVSTECKVSPTDENTTGSRRWPPRAQQNHQVYGFHRSAYGSSTSRND
jgi:hypothetical protein